MKLKPKLVKCSRCGSTKFDFYANQDETDVLAICVNCGHIQPVPPGTLIVRHR